MVNLISDAVVSPYEELMAYEYLYAIEGSTRKKISEELQEHGGMPTDALRQRLGLIPDDQKMSVVRDYVSKRLDGFSVLVDGTPQFPNRLHAERNPLPIFYYRGDITLVESRCVSVVGTRSPSERGSLAARRVARALAERDITVVTGLAKGIDTDATSEAIRRDGYVMGVIGTPIDRYYPAENRDLQDLVSKDHLLISQVPIYRYDHQPFNTKRYYFPERNITMAALSEATVIVEAGETSGTRTQARACLDQGKKLIFLPGAVESASWAVEYVKKGALIAKSVSEAMDMVG